MINPEDFIPCIPVSLPEEKRIMAAVSAIEINPTNRPDTRFLEEIVRRVIEEMPGAVDTHPDITPPEYIALLTTKYWGAGGVKLTVGFMESIAADLRDRILSHMNAWGAFGNVQFVWTQNVGSAQVRITRSGDGYWSYLGTDILQIPVNQPTMSLQGFTMSTPESEYHRVVRHETGHTLGFPHEHMRREIVNRLDPAKTIAWGRTVLGWSAQMVQQQILTPLEESSLIGTPHADQNSIMCYQLPASITKDGLPIAGGTDIDLIDQAFAQKVYPIASPPPTTTPPPPPPTTTTTAPPVTTTTPPEVPITLIINGMAYQGRVHRTG